MAEDTPAPDVPEDVHERFQMVRQAMTLTEEDRKHTLAGLLKSEFDGVPVWLFCLTNVGPNGEALMTYPLAIMVENDMADRLKEPK